MHRRAKNGKSWKEADDLGGVFTAIPNVPLRPAYSYGGGAARDVMLQCPVSAIPLVVFELHQLWREHRLLHVAPATWTPLSWRAFVTFEALMQSVEGPQTAERAAVTAVVGTMKAMGLTK